VKKYIFILLSTLVLYGNEAISLDNRKDGMLKYSLEYSGTQLKDSNSSLKEKYTGYTEVEIYNKYGTTNKEKKCIEIFLKDIAKGTREKDIYKAETDLYNCTPDGKLKESLHFHKLGPSPMLPVNYMFMNVSSSEMNKVIEERTLIFGYILLGFLLGTFLFLYFGKKTKESN